MIAAHALALLTLALVGGHKAPPNRAHYISVITSFSASPATVSITATDPDTGTFSNSASATWMVLVKLFASTWALTLNAAQATLNNCPGVPISAVQVTCTNVSSSGIGSVSSACGGPFTLSTSPSTLASGSDGVVVVGGSHTVSLQLSFQDQWKYPATSTACSVTLNYSLTAQ